MMQYSSHLFSVIAFILFVRLSSYAQTDFELELFESGSSHCYTITPSLYNGAVIAGRWDSTATDSTNMLMQITSNGQVGNNWSFDFDRGYLLDLKNTDDAGFIGTGAVVDQSQIDHTENASLIKFTSQGEIEWRQTFPSNSGNTTRGIGIVPISNGYLLYVEEYIWFTGEPKKFFLIKTDLHGNEIWRKDAPWCGVHLESTDAIYLYCFEYYCAGTKVFQIDTTGEIIRSFDAYPNGYVRLADANDVWVVGEAALDSSDAPYKHIVHAISIKRFTWDGILISSDTVGDYDADSDVHGLAFAKTKDNSYVVVAYREDLFGTWPIITSTFELQLYKFDTLFNKKWERTFSNLSYSITAELVVTDHAYIFATTGSNNNSYYPVIVSVLDTDLPPEQSLLLSYPNPARDKARIDISSFPDSNISVQLFDLSGRIFTIPTTFTGNQVILELAAVPAGLYIVRLYNDQKNMIGKIVVQ